MINGAPYQQRYAPPAARPEMGKVADLSFTDWLMLGGGAIVTGSGITAAIAALPSSKRKTNLVGLVVGGVVALVGGTTFVSEFRKLTA
jgi:hypothetical protein